MPNSGLSRKISQMAARVRELWSALTRPLVPGFILALVKKMGRDDVTVLAAAIAYYGFLSIFPLALALIALVGLALPSEHLQGQIMDFFTQYFPGSGDLLQQNISD